MNNDFGPKRLSVELTNICNLHCSYCLRDDDALYHTPANFLPADLLDRILVQACHVMGITSVVFTGGEPTLHPDFSKILEVSEKNGVSASFVTNGWHFEKLWPVVVAHRKTISHIGFSLDGVTAESHDEWRGEGSFARVVKALSRCFAAGIPFVIKVGIRKDTVADLERITLFSARLGAAALNFAHLMPTSSALEDSSSLSYIERARADQEIANLARIFKMKIGIDVGYHNLDVSPPCSALAGVSCNIDYQGRLSLCCNLSGFRGSSGESDVVADLTTEEFASAYDRLKAIASNQLRKRRERLETIEGQPLAIDPYVASPCLFCLDTFGKLPWRSSMGTSENQARTLPVLRVL